MKKLDTFVIRFCDIVIALVLLPFFTVAFVLLVIPQLVCFGAIFYTSTRIGQGGGNFRYVKLKSMRDGASASSGGGRAHLESWRIPLWGRLLRKTHLDEIPELFFILAGKESFVGPRPLLAEHAALVDTPERRTLKPGWTGLSQIFLKTREILPSRIQRRLDRKLAVELRPLLYGTILCATLCATRRRRPDPGPTVTAYRQSILARQGGTSENS